MKILLATYTHPDFLPPVYEFYSVLVKKGYTVTIISTSSDAKESLKDQYNLITVANTWGSSIFQKVLFRNFLEKKISETAVQNEVVISFCEVSFLMVEKAQKKKSFRHLHHSLEMYQTSFANFLRAPLSTIRRYTYLRKLRNCEFISTPSYERSGWLTGICNLPRPAHTILNCQDLNEGDLNFIKHKLSTPKEEISIIHTGGVNHTRSVLELVIGFHHAKMPNTKLTITNLRNNKYCDSIKAYVEEHNLTNVQLLGPISREDLIEIQKNADLGVCFMKASSELDSRMLAPNKIGEYLKYGLSIISNDAPYMDIFAKNFLLISDVNDKDQVTSAITKSIELIKDKNGHFLLEILKWYNMEHQMRHLLNHLLKSKKSL